MQFIIILIIFKTLIKNFLIVHLYNFLIIF